MVTVVLAAAALRAECSLDCEKFWLMRFLNRLVLYQVGLKTDQKPIGTYRVDFKPIRYSTVSIWIQPGT